MFLRLLALATVLVAQDTTYPPIVTKLWELSRFSDQLRGPETPQDFPSWLRNMHHWRTERLRRIGYDDALYVQDDLSWTQSSFIQSMALLWDRYLYDSEKQNYTADRYLDDLEKRFGGVDNVVLWHHYPNLGIDDRNQYDLFRDLPGGVEGLRGLVNSFHRRGVRVLLALVPWDGGTRDEGAEDWEALTKLVADVGADGVYGDTLNAVPLAWRQAAERLDHPLALEPQNSLMGEQLAWNLMSWGEEWIYPRVPSVSNHKWLEPRHMVHVVRRRAQDKTDDLQYAFFNGAGFVAWENIWGARNQFTTRDAEALRRIARIERQFGSLLISNEWEPHTSTLQAGVFASKFSGKGETLWTVVNRNEHSVGGAQLEVPHLEEGKYFDVWRGKEITPRTVGKRHVLAFELEPRGYGAVLAIGTKPMGDELSRFLTTMRSMSQTPLSAHSAEWKFLPQQICALTKTTLSATAPLGMVLVPGGEFDFVVSGIEIEGGNSVGVDVQYPWEESPRRNHSKRMLVAPFYMDIHPVTNKDFKRFMDATGYTPADAHNFLRHWENGSFPKGWENKPIVWVSLEDARAYAKWAGKRLPREWEWQYAAQGTDGRLYPWGDEWNPSAVPPPETGREMRPASDVGAFPAGSSPFGVQDLVGHVWQWTDEFSDEYTRAAVLRGASSYRPLGSSWYFPQAVRLDQHAKYLLMAPSLDRSAAIGFRCVVDAAQKRTASN
ncbi:MAG: formylglycine-generating enzyme family protein [Acidobacteria bacterium]|nr:formylglycine-generating enzyme family protein [Acidobacteriota bacterium]